MNEKKNIRNAHRKYDSVGFERHLPSTVDVNVYDVLFFVQLLNSLFEISAERQ